MKMVMLATMITVLVSAQFVHARPQVRPQEKSVKVTFIMPASVHAQWQRDGVLPVEVATTFASKVAAVKKGGTLVGGFANARYNRAQGQKFSTALLDNQKNGFLITPTTNKNTDEERVVVHATIASAQLVDGAHINLPI